MRAVAYAKFRGPLTVIDVPEPTAPDGGAVVRVEATGLCRSDWHGWMGHDADIVTFPHTPGHEFAGTVTAVGSGVDPGWVGQAVTAPFVLACGDCPVCAGGDGQICPRQKQPGFSLPGSFAQSVVVTSASTNLVALPESLAPSVAAGLGCRVATAYRGLVQRARVQPDEWVAVIGCGGVGLSAVAIARSRGARVVAVDPNPSALRLAEELGAEVLVRSGADAVASVVEATGGGAHVAMDAFGSPETCRDSVLTLRRGGRQIQVGLLGEAAMAEVPMTRVIAWELDLLGSHGMAARDYGALLDDVVSGRLELSRLMAPEAPMSLEQAAVALPELGTGSPVAGIRLIDPWL
ncbi:MAG: alcohol dehydrogenase catalytic domain-containing protein [Actinomycetales bacterium]|nr:alcohol dehydrogenase catalytic domain-containing protein [Dietzia sp.]NLW98671.1 alcohol dehydrogenase catalytic domain-containing protein [Actinomycetales bacterium]